MSPRNSTAHRPDTHPPINSPPNGASEPRIDSRAWFDHRRVIEIDHHGTIYRLRCTAQGKLILTK